MLSWQPAIGALQYQAAIKGPDGFQLTQDWQPGLSYSIGSLLPGTYEWSVTARNSAGENAASANFTVQPGKDETPNPIAAPYEADFSADVPGWLSNGPWQRAGFSLDTVKHTGWMFGTDGKYAKDNSPSSGELTSPSIFIGYAGQQFTFQYASYTESAGPTWDQRRVQLSVDGAAFQDIMQITTSSRDHNLFESKPVDLSKYVGKNIRFRFRFDTIDGKYNDGLGWAIKAVRISDDPTKVCSEYTDDGSVDKARGIKLGSNVDGQLCPVGDVDVFSFQVDKKQSFSAVVNITSADKDWTPSLSVLSSDGTSVIAEGKADASTSKVNTSLPEAGSYYLKVSGQAATKGSTPAVDYHLSLVQDTTPPTVKLTKPADGSISLALPINLSAEAADANGTVSRVEFLIQPVGVAVDASERVSVDENGQDGWAGSIPAGYAGKLEGSAVFRPRV